MSTARPLGAASVLVLAAGLSRRFSNGDKLHAELGGLTLLERSLALWNGMAPKQLLVVVKPDDSAARVAAEAARAVAVVNPSPEQGLETSLRAGMNTAINRRFITEGLMVAPADLPLLTASNCRSVYESAMKARKPVRGAHMSEPGHPVFWPRAAVEGWVRSELSPKAYLDRVGCGRLELGAGSVMDVDTEDDLVRMRGMVGPD